MKLNQSLVNISLIGLGVLTSNVLNSQAAFAFDQNDLDTLLSTGDCVGCDLSNISSTQLTANELQGANLSDANLSGADLSGFELFDNDFSNANLSGVNLSNAILVSNDFTSTNLSNANLTGIETGLANSFELANASNATFSGASFFNIVSFINANLQNANFDNTVFDEITSFDGADLTGASFSGADLSGANFSDADLTSANLANTTIPDGSFGTAVELEFGRNNFPFFTAEAINLFTGVVGANLTNADLTGSTASDANISRSTALEGITLPNGTNPDFCSGTEVINTASGSFASQSGFGFVQNFSDCDFLISVASGNKINLDFDTFDVGDGTLSIFDGLDSSANLLAEFTGDTFNPLISTGENLFISFSNEFTPQTPGFVGNFTSSAINDEPPATTPEPNFTLTLLVLSGLGLNSIAKSRRD